MIFSLKVFVLDLSGLDMSREEEDLLCPEIMEDSEEDELCNEVMDRFERQRWEPLNLISILLWIDAVLPWESANVILPPDYVKRVTLWTVLTWLKSSKTGCNVPWTAC